MALGAILGIFCGKRFLSVMACAAVFSVIDIGHLHCGDSFHLKELGVAVRALKLFLADVHLMAKRYRAQRFGLFEGKVLWKGLARGYVWGRPQGDDGSREYRPRKR